MHCKSVLCDYYCYDYECVVLDVYMVYPVLHFPSSLMFNVFFNDIIIFLSVPLQVISSHLRLRILLKKVLNKCNSNISVYRPVSGTVIETFLRKYDNV